MAGKRFMCPPIRFTPLIAESAGRRYEYLKRRGLGTHPVEGIPIGADDRQWQPREALPFR